MKKKTIVTSHSFEKQIDKDLLKKESFVATIEALKSNMLKDNIILNDVDIATAINITENQFRTYWENDDAPEELFPLMRSKYNAYLNKCYSRIAFDIQLPDPLFEERKRSLNEKKNKRQK